MKARLKTNGEIVEVEDLYDDGTALVKGSYMKVSELDFFNLEYIDWEQRRYEIAKAAMQGILCALVVEGGDPNPTHWGLTARAAVRNADALIKELKKGE